MKRLLLGLVVVALILGPVPVWTARRVEAQRKEALRQAANKADSIVACPADDSFFEFLGRHHTVSDSSNPLWRPVCRKTEPPFGQVFVKADRADSFRQCLEAKQLHRWVSVQCSLDAAVSFLDKPGESRSFARMVVADIQGREVVWITSEPLAWDENLRQEHRFWMLLVMACVGSFLLVQALRNQWNEAVSLQRSLGVAEAQPPMRLERLLLCVLPSFNIPQEIDDLREEYAEKLADEGHAKANDWYRWQVRQSLFSCLSQWSYRLLRRASTRTSTGGG